MTLKDKSVYVNNYRIGERLDPATGVRSVLTPTVLKLTRTRDGTKLKDWKSRIERGVNATTPMTGTFRSLEIARGFTEVKWSTVSGAAVDSYEKSWGYPIANKVAFSIGSLDAAKATRLAATKYLKKIREATVQFSGPIFLGEAAETKRMLRRPAEAIYKSAKDLLRAIKQRKRANPRTWPDALAGLWLEHSFGWSPLLNDIEDAAKAVRRLKQERHIHISASGIDSERIFDNGTLQGQLSVSYGPASLSYGFLLETSWAESRAIVRHRGILVPRVEMQGWEKSELFGFTPSEFVPTAWELLPWSFLVDYFTNIGDILSSAVTSTADVRWTNTSIIQEGIRHYHSRLDIDKIRQTLGSKFISARGNPGYFRATDRVVSRFANTGIYLPAFAWETPGSAKRLFNIAALLQQAGGIHPQRSVKPYRPPWFYGPRWSQK